MRRSVFVFAMSAMLAACGGSGGGADTSPPAVAVAIATPLPTPTPTPAPTPTSEPTRALVVARGCTAAENMLHADALRITPNGAKVLVVAIGSSSTQGAYASSPAASYPSVMQQLLSARGGAATFQVLNKGVGGDTLPGTQNRLQADVINQSPQLVIVQAGSNDSVNDPSGTGLADFTARLRSVVTQLKPKMAVVLMNSQHYPNEPGSYLAYQAVLQQVADEQGVALFDRYGLMKSWIDSGKYSYADILASDYFHPNDFTYRCMGQVAADLTYARTVGAGM